jgi:aspartyl-tRNA(Asn)/glutamyl-tRNA(Gln) amidotransferase subunit C
MNQRKKDSLSRQDIEKIARLAHIDLSEEEKKLFADQFNKILNFFKTIDEAHTEGVSPTFHVLDLVNIFRKDDVKDSLSQEEALNYALKKEDGYIKSPKIV